MWIDINAYVGHWPFLKLRYNNCECLLRHMDKYGVNYSIVSNLNGIFYKNTQSANQELYDEIKSLGENRHRLIPFAVINPIYAGWKKDMDFCMNILGMRGIRLYPKYHDYSITDPALVELVKRARDLNVPVAFNFRMVDSRQRSWMDINYVTGTIKPEWDLKDILPIIKEVPDAKYMILAVANSIHLDEADMKFMKKVDFVMDTSGRTLNNLHSLLKVWGRVRFSFGTHFPIFDYLTGMLRIEALRGQEADSLTKEFLRSGNADRILNS